MYNTAPNPGVAHPPVSCAETEESPLANPASSKYAPKRALRVASIALTLSVGLPLIQVADPSPEPAGLPVASADATVTTGTSGLVTASSATPNEPHVIFNEDFESKTGLTSADLAQVNPVLTLSNSAYSYPQYKSKYNNTSGAAMTYTGDAYWMNHNQCNGVVLNYLTTDAGIYKPQNVQPGLAKDESCNGGWDKSVVDSDPGSARGERIFARNNNRRLAYVLGLVDQGVNKTNGVLDPTIVAPNQPTVLYPQGYNVAGSEGKTKYEAALNNDAVTAYSMAKYPSPAQTLVFKNATPVDLSGMNTGKVGSRFYTTSVDVAELSCGSAANSSLLFTLYTNADRANQTPYPMTGSTNERIVACTDSRLGYYTAPTDAAAGHDFLLFSSAYTYWGPWAGVNARGGRFYSPQAKLLTATEASSVRVELGNSTQGHTGNDFAFDNIRIVDATPTLYKEFVPKDGSTDGMVAAGNAVTLKFRVVNTSDLSGKSGWSFTDKLPTGMKVATTPNAKVVGNCTATFAPAAGQTHIAVTNGVLNQGAEDCTLSVDVVPDASANPTQPGEQVTFTNCPTTNIPTDAADGYLTLSTGVDFSDCADITYYVDPLLDVEKSASPDSTDLGANGGVQQGDEVSYSISFKNTGRDPKTIAYRDDLTGVLDDADFTGTVTLVTKALDSNGQPGATVANTVTATWNAANKRIDFGGSIAAKTVVTATYKVTVKNLERPGAQTWGDLTLKNCVRPTGETTGGECTETPVVPPTFVSVTKNVLDFAGQSTPGEGWKISIASNVEFDGMLTPQSTTQTTPASGKVQWELEHADLTAKQNLTVSEDPASKPGYTVDSFTCTVTPLGGTATKIDGVDPQLGVPNVAPGSTVDCVVTNKPVTGQVQWSKTDPEGVLLEGSTWEITRVGGSSNPRTIEDCVAQNGSDCSAQQDKNPAAGEFTVTGLEWGEYKLVETKAPAGYERSSEEHTFTIKADALTHTFADSFVNRLREALVIPLTGGTGTHIFTLTGVAGLATAALFLWRRNTKRAGRARSLT